ncbi:MAG: homoserine O-acetyltransferase [Geminicoccaceae bacterium]|nr:homoserine O-acetyltransferase [Geminicoccaceae bacterium]MDW8339984.1 homoserine O-acetyltransferase [Geminicoccaceae bacterium]
MVRTARILLFVAALATSAGWSARAGEVGLVEKRVFELPSYTTVGGKTIAPVRVGWESYGRLNEAKDNAILITHFFSGTSHAAGKYSESDPAPGYWNAIIGPGKAIDTDRWFVLSSDTLVNLNAYDPKVITTGPATINPATGKPWGTEFPIVTIRDFVNVQKALLESLGIRKLHAVVGASMGALQAFEWASAHPEMVGRVVPVIGAGWVDPFLVGWLDAWATPIRLDPNWNGGDYYGKTPPSAGLAAALKLVTLHARWIEWADKAFGRSWAEEGKDPAAALGHRFKIEAALEATGAARAKLADANHFLYLVKANQLFVAGGETVEKGLARIQAPVLLVAAKEDLIFFPRRIEETARAIAADGTPVEIVWLDGTDGHLDGITAIGQAAERIKAFLER